jgi:hypothetical protein
MRKGSDTALTVKEKYGWLASQFVPEDDSMKPPKDLYFDEEGNVVRRTRPGSKKEKEEEEKSADPFILWPSHWSFLKKNGISGYMELNAREMDNKGNIIAYFNPLFLFGGLNEWANRYDSKVEVFAAYPWSSPYQWDRAVRKFQYRMHADYFTNAAYYATGKLDR